jgi:hypothetical protein
VGAFRGMERATILMGIEPKRWLALAIFLESLKVEILIQA